VETKIGLVPRAIVTGATGGVREYGVLITDKRSIFVLEKGVSAWASGAVGAVIASAASTKKTFDYQNASPEELASMAKSVSIQHDSVRRLRLKKGFWRAVPNLLIEYDDPGGKRRKLKALLQPPGELMKQQKKEGMGRKKVLLEYATKVKEAYQKALPPTQSMQAEWQI